MHVGGQFSKRLWLDSRSIRDFARAAGDLNPVHHDRDYARSTRFGDLIASGAQLSSLMMGLTAAKISEQSPMLGLDFRFRFRRAVKADTFVTIWWQVVAQRPSAALGGDVLLLAGRMRTPAGDDAVKAVGKVLLVDQL